MNFGRVIAHKVRDVSDRTRARVALGSDVGTDVRIVGIPSVVRHGALRVGSGVVIVSVPAPVTIVVHTGASIVIEDGVTIESGAVLRASKRIVIGAGAHVGAGVIIDDEASDEELRIAAGAVLGDGALYANDAQAVPEKVNSVHDAARLDRIRAVVADITEAAKTLDSSADMRTLPDWDSLLALRVIVALEKELGTTLPHDLFAQPCTIESIATLTSGER